MPKNADKEQNQIANELKDIGKGKMPNEKICFLKNARLIISAREKNHNNFKSKIFLTKNLEPKPGQTVYATSKQKKNKLINLHLSCMQTIIKKLPMIK